MYIRKYIFVIRLKINSNTKQCDLPKIREPFDKLGSIIFVELDIRKVHLDHGG